MQVLLNLMSNAVKFTPSNGKITISARLIQGKQPLQREYHLLPELAPYHREADLLEVSVSDNGTGIKDDALGKLFTLYGFIAETKEVNTHGIGLGSHLYVQIGINSVVFHYEDLQNLL